ncbi:MAG: tetratricopeptide repeat protein [Bacillota bacterium]
MIKVTEKHELDGSRQKQNKENNDGEPWAWIRLKPVSPQKLASFKVQFKRVAADSNAVQPQLYTECAEDQEQSLAEAKRLFELGQDGDKCALLKAHHLIKKLFRESPQKEDVIACYGSILCLLGRDAPHPNLRNAQAAEGLKMLDQAVNMSMDSIPFRLLRANICFRFPELNLHCTHTAIGDFSYLASVYEKDNTVFSLETYYQILFNLGFAFMYMARIQEAWLTWLKLYTAAAKSSCQDVLEKEGQEQPVEASPSEVAIEVSPADTEKAHYDAVLQEGLELHSHALNGRKDYSSRAFLFFSKIREERPGDQLIEAYYADCLSMTGRDAADPKTMFGNVYKSVQSMDTAANKDSDNIKIRILRAYHSFRLPEVFHRTEAAIGDFEYLIGRYEKDKKVLSQKTYWKILYDCGLAYKRLGFQKEANLTWKKLLSLNPDPEYMAKISQQQEVGQIDGAESPGFTESKEYFLREGIRLHGLGVAGDRKAAIKSHDLLKRAYEMDPNNLLAMAYFGSSTALLGRDASEPNKMFENTFKGLKLIKQALLKDGKDHRIRLLRAYLTHSLPGFFNLAGTAIEDFRVIKEAYEQDNSILPPEKYWQVLYNLGVAYLRTGNAVESRKVWSQLLSETPDPKYRKMINLES